MNVIGISGLSNSIAFKKQRFPNLSQRQYNIAQGFDSAAALVRGNDVIAAAAEERFTREKATGAFPANAIRYCLTTGALKPEQVDFVAHGFSYEPHKASFQADDFSRGQYEEVFAPANQVKLLSQHFPGTHWQKKFVPVPHHLAHAASAFYLSGYDESLILTSDGMGEVQSATVALGKGNDITVLAEIPAFHSLGALYGVFTLYLGFYMNSDEYKVMGLAPYGNSRRFFNDIMEFVALKNDGTYTLPVFANNQTVEERETHSGVLRLLTEKFGPAREPEAEITQTHKDLAASLQSVLQTCQLHLLRHFKRQTGQRNLCMAGGVALNCSGNGLIKRSELFDRVFVQQHLDFILPAFPSAGVLTARKVGDQMASARGIGRRRHDVGRLPPPHEPRVRPQRFEAQIVLGEMTIEHAHEGVGIARRQIVDRSREHDGVAIGGEVHRVGAQHVVVVRVGAGTE